MEGRLAWGWVLCWGGGGYEGYYGVGEMGGRLLAD
jgi:hypothetical protein